jgi:uncharacterized protein YndB with AHSA1/START domain
MNPQAHPLVLELKCVVDAARERTFGLLTEPAELARWWGPHGFTTPEIQLDLSVGAGYRFTMQPPDGEAFHLSGRFLEVEPPSRLSYTFSWDEPHPDDRETVVRISLTAARATTELAMTQGEFATGERLALHHRGWTDAFERLRALVEENSRET